MSEMCRVMSGSVRGRMTGKGDSNRRLRTATYSSQGMMALPVSLKSPGAVDIDRGLRRDLIDLFHRLQEVAPLDMTPDVFDRVVLHRNNRFYAFLIEVCRVLQQSLLVDPTGGRTTFRDFVGDERAMARVFERFVRNFYRREQTAFECDSERVSWADVEGTPEDLAYLPGMRTDVTLRSAGRTIVLDTKYYASCVQSFRG